MMHYTLQQLCCIEASDVNHHLELATTCKLCINVCPQNWSAYFHLDLAIRTAATANAATANFLLDCGGSEVTLRDL